MLASPTLRRHANEATEGADEGGGVAVADPLDDKGEWVVGVASGKSGKQPPK
jgi:hypothetical protein